MEATSFAEPRGQAIAELNSAPLSPRQRYAAGLIAFGEFIDGYDLLVMGAAVILLRKQFGLTPQEVGLLGASTFLGAVVGLLVFGDLSDRVGRRSIFVINLFFFVVFAIGSALVTNVTRLFIMRFLVGVGVGMDIPTSTAYLAEIAPAKQRGAVLGSLLNMMWILGALTSTLLAIPLIAYFGDDAWRWMLGLAAIPALLILFARQGLPESPRWLLVRGRVDEARAALATFGIDADAAIQQCVRARPDRTASCSVRAYIKRLVLVSLVFTLNCFSGSISTVAAPLVLNTVGAMSINSTLFFSATIWVTALCGVLTSAFLIDRIGRRKLCYLSVIPFGMIALLMSVFAQRSSIVLVIGFYALSYVDLARHRRAGLGLVERAFPDASAGTLARRLQRLVPAGDLAQHLPRADRDGGPGIQCLYRHPVDPDVPDRLHRLALSGVRKQHAGSGETGSAELSQGSNIPVRLDAPPETRAAQRPRLSVTSCRGAAGPDTGRHRRAVRRRLVFATGSTGRVDAVLLRAVSRLIARGPPAAIFRVVLADRQRNRFAGLGGMIERGDQLKRAARVRQRHRQGPRGFKGLVIARHQPLEARGHRRPVFRAPLRSGPRLPARPE